MFDTILERVTGVMRETVDRLMVSTKKRARYQEALMTELLTELAGKKLVSNEECRNVIKRAQERAAQEEEHEKAQSPKCPCPDCDTRLHNRMDCGRCGAETPHLIESDVARCRLCCTAQEIAS